MFAFLLRSQLSFFIFVFGNDARFASLLALVARGDRLRHAIVYYVNARFSIK